jgi:quinol monooxygenase YgiN
MFEDKKKGKEDMQIIKESTYVTLINVFETTPEQQQQVVDSWLRAVELSQNDPGIIAAALHKSLDGTRVINYAQWRSKADHERHLMKNREQREARQSLTERVDSHLYEVVYLFERRDED